MISPLIKVLFKIFVKGFYKAHSGLLLFFLVTVIMYGFFVEVLNHNHLPPSEVIKLNLLIVLTLISSPVALILVLVCWLIFTIKSWNYVSAHLLIHSNQFLFYSSTYIKKIDQFKSWFIVQFCISLPIVGYGLFVLSIGIIFGHHIAPIMILSFIFLLALISAFVYVSYVNHPVKVNSRSIFSRMINGWRKPFFSLFIYHAFDKLKIPLLITKFISCTIIVGGTYLLANVNDDLTVSGIITLGVVTAHAILVYRSFQFENMYLSFSRNFPLGKNRIYMNWAIAHLLLTLPENCWLLARLDVGVGILLLLFNLSLAMLFRNLLYLIGSNMKKYLYWVFYLFNLCFVAILLKLIWVIVPLTLFISIVIFNNGYYKQRSFLKS